MGTCPTDAQWEAYLQGDEDDADGRFESHLAACPTCPKVVRGIQERLVRDERPPAPPTGVVRQLDELARAASPAGRPPDVPGYTELAYLARGGMSVVYQARDTLGGPVAVKFLERGAFASEAEIREFLVEADRCRQLAAQPHPNGRWGLVEIRDSGECPGRGPFIVMELAAGGSLYDRIRGGPLDPQQAAGLLAEVADTVEGLHAAGLLHRDLKPANILFRPRPDAPPADEPKLLDLSLLDPLVSDLGMAKAFDPAVGASATVGLKGTPEYMAPELLRGERPSRASDVYALGAALYECLTRRPPFRAGSTPDLIAEIRNGHPSLPRRYNRQLPRALEAVCLRCLEKDPRKRYGSAGELADDLRRYLAGDRVRATLPGPHRRAWWWVRQYPFPAAVAALLAAVAVAASGWAVAKDRDSKLDQIRVQAAEREKKDAEAVAEANATAATEARLREHEVVVRAAQAAARRGDWPAALTYYDRAITDRLPADAPFPDQLPLRVERLWGYFAVNDEATLTAELAALQARPDLGRLAAKVALVRGAHLLCDSAARDAGLAAVRQALAQREHLLAPSEGQQNLADVALAEAMAEARPVAVIAWLREAVRHDPLHYPAESSLVVALLATGQPDEARRRADRMEDLFPASPVPPLIRAVVAVIYGDRPAMRANVAEMGRRLRTDLSAFLRYCETLGDILDIMVSKTPPEDNSGRSTNSGYSSSPTNSRRRQLPRPSPWRSRCRPSA